MPSIAGVGVELADELQEFGLAGVGRQRVLDRMEAAFLGLLAFGRDIDLAGGILADDDDGEPGCRMPLGDEVGGHALDRLDNVFGNQFSVDDVGHAIPPVQMNDADPHNADYCGRQSRLCGVRCRETEIGGLLLRQRVRDRLVKPPARLSLKRGHSGQVP